MSPKNDDKKDLTHIGELPEFLHEEDPELDKLFEDNNPSSQHEGDDENGDQAFLDDELPPEIPIEEIENSDESIFSDKESHSEILSESGIEFEQVLEDNTDIYLEELTPEETLPDETNDEVNQEYSPIGLEESQEEAIEQNATSVNDLDDDVSYIPPQKVILPEETSYENFDEVKKFSQNFSYGTIESAGNPPYSIIIRNVVFEEDANDILYILKELGIVSEKNNHEYEQSLKIGAVLIPQISEFTAITLAHKLRRFDIDLEVGLSDAITPPKNNETNPRGLTKKKDILQNIEESKKLSNLKDRINDMIITTAHHLDGYKIAKYLGIHNVNTIIPEEELERLQFVDQSLKNNEIENDDLKVYLGYKESFNELHQNLVSELKNKALKEEADAIIGLQFHTSHLTELAKRSYQINCSATLVKIEKEI